MVMEMRSDKIIQDKINSVNDLPEGYSPNLNSKWELLQAGLKPEQNKKPVLYYVQRASAVAAMLLLIGGSSLLIIKKPTKTSDISKKPGQVLGIVLGRISMPQKKGLDLHLSPCFYWSGRHDSNMRPSVPKTGIDQPAVFYYLLFIIISI